MKAAFETFEALEGMVRGKGKGKGREDLQRWGMLLFEHKAPSMMDRQCCTRGLVGTVVEMRKESGASDILRDEEEERIVK